jgi:hypothetical protein
MAGTRAKPELRTVTIAIVAEGTEAENMQNKLRSGGVESFLASETSYVIKKSHEGTQHQARFIRSLPDAAASTKQRGAVKVQVARADVERALSILGAANLAINPGAGSRPDFPDLKARKASPGMLGARDPTVPIIVVAFVLIAVLILSLS